MTDAVAMVEHLNALVEDLEQHADAEVREKALDVMQIILELHGEVLRRILSTLDSLPEKEQLLARIMGDEVVSAILLIHGLLPVDLQTRVAVALDKIHLDLLAQGCDVELLSIDGGRARLRLMRSGKGAPPIATLKSEVEKTLIEAVPDLIGIDIEGVAEQIEATAKAAALLSSMLPARSEAPQSAKLVQIKRPRSNQQTADGIWVSVLRSIGFEEGQLKIVNYEDINVLICKIDGDFYAYRNACAAGGRQLDDALFESPVLSCSCHGYGYDLRRRGVCVEKPELRLESLPLKIEDDKVKVIAK